MLDTGELLEIVICAKWGTQRTSVPCVMKTCDHCSTEIALSERNIEITRGFTFLCPSCGEREMERHGVITVGAIFNGRDYPDALRGIPWVD